MITVHCAIMQDELIHLLEHADTEMTFTFKEKLGIKLMFDVNSENIEEAIAVAKTVIKQSDLGKSIYFQVTK